MDISSDFIKDSSDLGVGSSWTTTLGGSDRWPRIIITATHMHTLGAYRNKGSFRNNVDNSHDYKEEKKKYRIYYSVKIRSTEWIIAKW